MINKQMTNGIQINKHFVFNIRITILCFFQRRTPKLLHIGLHHSYQESSTNLQPPNSSNSNMIQHRSLSTNIPLVDHDMPSPMNLSTINKTSPTSSIHTKLVASSSFTRTASKKRREFSKDKRNVSTNVDAWKNSTPFDGYLPIVHQVKTKRKKEKEFNLILN